MGNQAGHIGDPIYGTWRDAMKNQTLARCYLTDLHHFSDIEFQQIVTGVRRLRPACDELATVSAANNIPRMQDVDEAVVQLVKDYGKKLTNTIRGQISRFHRCPGSLRRRSESQTWYSLQIPPREPVGSCPCCAECRRWAPKCSTSQCTRASSNSSSCPGCWSIPKPSSPAEFPKANPTSFASLWKSWSV